jgi:hypothetical protein
MKKLALLALLTGCAGTPVAGNAIFGHQVRRFHDDSMNVTCWTVLGEGAIACYPDYMLKPLTK